MERQNVTLSLPKELLKKAKATAASKDKSLSELLRESLEQKIKEATGFKKAKDRRMALLKQGTDLGTKGQMKITREDVEKVGHLARLELDSNTVETLTVQMDAILAYVEKLNEIDTSRIVPTSHAVPLENAFRQDQVTPSLGAAQALAAAPERVGEFFRVPRVIE